MLLLSQEKKVKAVHFNNGWIEFDTNEDYEKVIYNFRNDTLSNILINC